MSVALSYKVSFYVYWAIIDGFVVVCFS